MAGNNIFHQLAKKFGEFCDAHKDCDMLIEDFRFLSNHPGDIGAQEIIGNEEIKRDFIEIAKKRNIRAVFVKKTLEPNFSIEISNRGEYTETYLEKKEIPVEYGGGVTGYTVSENLGGGYSVSENRSPIETKYKTVYEEKEMKHSYTRSWCFDLKTVKKGSLNDVIEKEKIYFPHEEKYLKAKAYIGEQDRGKKSAFYCAGLKIKMNRLFYLISFLFMFLAFLLIPTLEMEDTFFFGADWGKIFFSNLSIQQRLIFAGVLIVLIFMFELLFDRFNRTRYTWFKSFDLYIRGLSGAKNSSIGFISIESIFFGYDFNCPLIFLIGTIVVGVCSALYWFVDVYFVSVICGLVFLALIYVRIPAVFILIIYFMVMFFKILFSRDVSRIKRVEKEAKAFIEGKKFDAMEKLYKMIKTYDVYDSKKRLKYNEFIKPGVYSVYENERESYSNY